MTDVATNITGKGATRRISARPATPAGDSAMSYMEVLMSERMADLQYDARFPDTPAAACPPRRHAIAGRRTRQRLQARRKTSQRRDGPGGITRRGRSGGATRGDTGSGTERADRPRRSPLAALRGLGARPARMPPCCAGRWRCALACPGVHAAAGVRRPSASSVEPGKARATDAQGRQRLSVVPNDRRVRQSPAPAVLAWRRRPAYRDRPQASGTFSMSTSSGSDAAAAVR